MGGNVKMDFSGLRQYRKQLMQMQAETDAFFIAMARELAARLLAKVIKRTPVGVKPKIEGPKIKKIEGKSGKKRSFLTREGAMLEEHWKGYSGGTLRRGWTAKTESEANSKGVGMSAVQYAQSLDVQRVGNVYRITIINPVSYASYVEYGHRQTPGRFVGAIGKRLKKSWVEGQFMLTISEMELRDEAPAIIERKIAALLRSVMHGK